MVQVRAHIGRSGRWPLAAIGRFPHTRRTSRSYGEGARFGALDEEDSVSSVCWQCGTRPADFGSAQKVQLHKGSTEQTVAVPTCPACAAVLRRQNIWMQVVLWIGLLGGIAGGVATGSWVTDLEERGLTDISGALAGWLVGITLFVLAIVAAVLVSRNLARRGGFREQTGPYPEVQRLTQSGWKVGAAPKPSSTAEGVAKTCSNCGKVVPARSHSGERCPHCGAYWSFEQERVVR